MMPSPFDPIGLTVGRYRLDERVGEGGMSLVYRGRDTLLGKDVAVKFIRAERIIPEAYPEMLARFRREAGALARFSHPNILKITDYGEHDGHPYFVTDLVRGGTLDVKKALAWPQAVARVLPIARALDYAHNRGIVHRDVKPSNILLAEDGTPVLADFGIAKILEDEVELDGATATVGLGTPDYMAPEQVLGREVDMRADVYALAVVLYELATGRKLFEADSPIGVMLKHVNEPPSAPRRHNRRIPQQAEAVLLKALAKQPHDRFVSMAAFIAALEGTIRRPRFRRRDIARILVALTLLGSIGIGIGLTLQNEDRILAALNPTAQIVIVTVWPTNRPPTAPPPLTLDQLQLPLLVVNPTPGIRELSVELQANVYENELVMLELIPLDGGPSRGQAIQPEQFSGSLTFVFSELLPGRYGLHLSGAPLQTDVEFVTLDSGTWSLDGAQRLDVWAKRTDLRVYAVRPGAAGQALISWRPFPFLLSYGAIYQIDALRSGTLLGRALVEPDLSEVSYPRDFLNLSTPVTGEALTFRVRVLHDMSTITPDEEYRVVAEGLTSYTWP